MFFKICREYKKMSHAELCEILRRESEVILPALSALNGDGTREFLLIVFKACADGEIIGDKEISLFCEATGIKIDREDIEKLISHSLTKDKKADIESVIDTFSLLDSNVKASMISFCLCLCAANGRITKKEKRFLKKLMK